MCDCFLKINIAKDSTVTVSWDITAVDGFSQEDIGPQIGKGELAGNIKDGQIWINMNPRIADYNIFLNGYYSNDGASWTENYIWRYSIEKGTPKV